MIEGRFRALTLYKIGTYTLNKKLISIRREDLFFWRIFCTSLPRTSIGREIKYQNRYYLRSPRQGLRESHSRFLNYLCFCCIKLTILHRALFKQNREHSKLVFIGVELLSLLLNESV